MKANSNLTRRGLLAVGSTLAVGLALGSAPWRTALADTRSTRLRLPAPTGPYQIGTTSLHLVDQGQVANPAAAFTSAPPPDGVVGTPYTFNFTAEGDASITFSVVNGALPPGLALTDGALSGTPSTAGTFDFLVRASGAGSSADRDTTIVIAPAAPGATTGGPSTSATSPTNPASPTSRDPDQPGLTGHRAQQHLVGERRRLVARRRHCRDLAGTATANGPGSLNRRGFRLRQDRRDPLVRGLP
jgi:hypothetical protein